MNLVVLFAADFIDATRVRLTDRRSAYIRDVHRARVGDQLRVGVLNDRVGLGRVTALAADAVELEIALTDDPPAPLPVTLLLALPRPKSLGRIVQAVTAMGVKRLALMHAYRVEKSFWASPLLSEDRLREQMIVGLEQGRDTVLPEITMHRRFKPFVEDEIAALAVGSLRLVAHPGASTPCPARVDGPVTLAVGPEGGFIAYEIDLLTRHGFQAVQLWARPLRVEHAVSALLGRLF